MLGVASGSSALYLALKSLGIKKGDEVLTTPFSWIITSNAIVECGAKPVFVDIGDDYNINENLIESKITKKTKAIVPMHWEVIYVIWKKFQKLQKNTTYISLKMLHRHLEEGIKTNLLEIIRI